MLILRGHEATAGRPTVVTPHDAIVRETDLAPLPEAARRYLRFMGVIGRPRVAWMRLAWSGRFRPRIDRDWMRCDARQINLAHPVARWFTMRLHWGAIPLVGRDTYTDGKGRLHIRLLGALPVLDATGPEYDQGELVTWLDDAVLFAPSMLLRPEVAWSPYDEWSFTLAVTDHRHTARARVFVDEDGRLLDFATEDRYYEDPSDRRLHRARWTTPVGSWQTIDGRPTPTSGSAIWHLPAGPFPYAELRVVPGSVARGVRNAPGRGGRS